MLASGSKDNSIKLWDPRQPREITALYPHKNTVTALRWHPAGHHVLSGSRDNLLKLFDLRTMREQATFKHHKREVPALAQPEPARTLPNPTLTPPSNTKPSSTSAPRARPHPIRPLPPAATASPSPPPLTPPLTPPHPTSSPHLAPPLTPPLTHTRRRPQMPTPDAALRSPRSHGTQCTPSSVSGGFISPPSGRRSTPSRSRPRWATATGERRCRHPIFHGHAHLPWPRPCMTCVALCVGRAPTRTRTRVQ